MSDGFSHCREMRLKRLSFPTACSMRARPGDRTPAKYFGLFFVFFL